VEFKLYHECYRLLKMSELADSAVLINEFGAIPLDHHLVETVTENTVVLNNGCICCTVRGELSGALHTLCKQRREGTVPYFQRVIIETTGLADPAPILHELLSHPLMRQDYRLTGVITCVDAALGMEQLDKEIEPLKQAAVADRLIITKGDLVENENLVALISRLQILNPVAELALAMDIDPAWLLKTTVYDPTTKHADVSKWLKAEKYRQIKPERKAMATAQDVHRRTHDVNRHDDRIHAFCVTFDEPVQWNSLLKALHMLVAIRGEHLLRVKGLIQVEDDDKPRVIHCVQHFIFDTKVLDAWPDQQIKTQIVFIVRDLEANFVEVTLNHFMEAAKNRQEARGQHIE
jgi:G3E family GTPase